MMLRAEIIAQHRRSQPEAELLRKARKAGRRRRRVRGGIGFSEEAKDLSFARSHAATLEFRASALSDPGNPYVRCCNCWRMAQDWDPVAKVYRKPIAHSENCALDPDRAPLVYAGTIFTGAVAKPTGRLP